MFTVNDDLSIYLTRGDTLFFSVSAKDHGYPYTFKPGDIVRISVTAKKDVTDVYIQKDFPVYEASKTVLIYLEGRETKIGEKINKYKDYWYEIVLNPDTVPQTIIGNDDDGAKILRLFPEADDAAEEEILPEEIPVVDAELDLVSNRPVSNRAVAAAVARLTAAIEQLKGNMPNIEEPDGSVFNALGQVEGLTFLAIDAYGVAVKNGFEGTVEEWLASLQGQKGDPGYVNYDLVAMGLPDVVLNGDSQQIEMDTTEIAEAMATSIVTVNLNVEYKGLIFHNVKATFLPNCNVATVNLLTTVAFVSVFVGEGKILVGIELPQGETGKDYILTEADKAAIAELAASMVDAPGSGGNVGVTFEGETMIISTSNNAVKIDGETLIL